MQTGLPTSGSRSVDASDSRHAQAWFLLVALLAIHVCDEAATGFLEFYNPLVLSVRAREHWFPMPTFTFGWWLAGLILLVIALTLLGRVLRSGSVGTRVVSSVFAGIMLLNGIGHLGGSWYFHRWLPGTTSAPLLVGASVLLGWRTWSRATVSVTAS